VGIRWIEVMGRIVYDAEIYLTANNEYLLITHPPFYHKSPLNYICCSQLVIYFLLLPKQGYTLGIYNASVSRPANSLRGSTRCVG